MKGFDENTFVAPLTWRVIPALPGTRIEWEAEWCSEGSVAVHAWLVRIDVIGRRDDRIDTSCCTGDPMILNAEGQLQVARLADLEGKPGDIIEPPA